MTINRHVIGHLWSKHVNWWWLLFRCTKLVNQELILDFFFVKNQCSSIISMKVWHRVHASSKQFATDENLHHVPQFVQFKMQTLSSQYFFLHENHDYFEIYQIENLSPQIPWTGESYYAYGLIIISELTEMSQFVFFCYANSRQLSWITVNIMKSFKCAWKRIPHLKIP